MFKPIGLVGITFALAGCAALHRVDSEVSTYSHWPAARQPASFTFERLPSQQARPEQQQKLEDAARPAIEKTGFTPAADPARADFVIQLGARVSATESVYTPFDDPFWWNGGFGYGYGYGPRFGGYWPGWYSRAERSRYEREVVVLIRERQSGQPLYEARAVNDSLSPSADGVLPAMFEAALKDFPYGGVNPRQVTIDTAPAKTR